MPTSPEPIIPIEGRIPDVKGALRSLSQMIGNDRFTEEIREILKTGANVELVIQVNHRPEGNLRVTIKRYALAGKQQLACYTRLLR